MPNICTQLCICPFIFLFFVVSFIPLPCLMLPMSAFPQPSSCSCHLTLNACTRDCDRHTPKLQVTRCNQYKAGRNNVMALCSDRRKLWADLALILVTGVRHC